DFAKKFNESQSEYKVNAVFKGSYPEAMAAAVAAFRAGSAPAILQVFEVGTATMMSAKGAIKPVHQVMADAGEKFDPKIYVPAVAGYYTNTKGQMLSFPFNSSTTVFFYNQDAVEKAFPHGTTCCSQARKMASPAPIRSCCSILRCT